MAFARVFPIRLPPDWVLGKLFVTGAYGQSRSDNRSEGTGSSFSGTRNPLQIDRNLMFNNNGAPGKPIGEAWPPATLSGVQAWKDGKDTTYGTVTMTTVAGEPIVVHWPGQTHMRENVNVLFATTGKLDSGIAPANSYFALNYDSGAKTFQLQDKNASGVLLGVPMIAVGDQSGAHEARTVKLGSPLGQSLGVVMHALDTADIANAQTLKRRLFFSGGEGGMSVASLSKNAPEVFTGYGNYFDRYMRMIDSSVSYASSLYGRDVVVETIPYLQHENDVNAGTDAATWKTATTTLFSDLRSEIVSRTGQSEAIVVLFDIGANTNKGTAASYTSELPLKQVEIARAGIANTFSVGPSYYLPRADSAGALHMTNEGVTVLGEMFARARSLIYQSGTPDFVYASSAIVSGDTIVITCHTVVGNLTVDETTIPAATGTNGDGVVLVRGFDFSDTAGHVVTGVSVSTNTITVTLSGAPTGTWTLRGGIAGLGSQYYTDLAGRRSKTAPSTMNIRDSFSQASAYVSGMALRNFLAPLKFTGTGATVD